MIECDVASDAAVRAAVDELAAHMPVLHGIVHSIAWAPAEDLQGKFVETSRDGFAAANDISSYSLISIAREAQRLMTEGGAIVTMTYAGSWRVIPNYNVMGPAKASLESSVRYLAADLGPAGIRVNAVSAGPIATVAARTIKDFSGMLDLLESHTPLRRNVTSRRGRRRHGLPAQRPLARDHRRGRARRRRRARGDVNARRAEPPRDRLLRPRPGVRPRARRERRRRDALVEHDQAPARGRVLARRRGGRAARRASRTPSSPGRRSAAPESCTAFATRRRSHSPTCVHLSLAVSDNDATNIVLSFVGLDKVNALAEELGLPATRMRRRMMDVEAREAGRENTTSAARHGRPARRSSRRGRA